MPEPSADLAPPFDQHVTFLHTAKLDATTSFYTEALRLPLVLDQGVCRIFQVSQSGFIGFCTNSAATTSAADGVILTLVSDDVDGWYRRLHAQGIDFEKSPSLNEKFNIYHCFLRDPNDYLVEIQKFLDPAWPLPTT